MSKIIPSFVVNGKTYEIKRTRYLECEHEKISNESSFTEEEQALLAKATKLRVEYEELAEKFREVKEKHFANMRNKELTAEYKAFKEELDEMYKELTDFEIKHEVVSLRSLQKLAANKAERLLILALCEQYNLPQKEAEEIWCMHVDNIGKEAAGEWVLFMIDALFNEEETTDPFLKQARAKAELKAEQRKGLSKVMK
jgi:predicted nuclease with TOPRIM domain